MVKFLCFILTLAKENVKHDEMNFSYIAFMFYTARLIEINFQLTTILFLNVLLLTKKQNKTTKIPKPNSLVRLEVTTSYFIEILCKKNCKRRK